MTEPVPSHSPARNRATAGATDREARALMRLASVGAALRLLAEICPTNAAEGEAYGLLVELLAGHCEGAL